MKGPQNSIVAVIPARFGSTRFPGKALVSILGKPMIQWVYERTRRSPLISRVIVATDDQRIADSVTSFGGDVVMTSPEHASGTDRIAEAARALACDIIVNVQGDEPLIQPAMIDEAVAPLIADPSVVMGTLCRKIEDRSEAFDPNVVKVVLDSRGFALYFSRAPIPWDRDRWGGGDFQTTGFQAGTMLKHIGLYVYRRDFLLSYAALPQSDLERIEKLEQLRALENGFAIKAVITQYESFGVDIPDDLGKILKRIQESREGAW